MKNHLHDFQLMSIGIFQSGGFGQYVWKTNHELPLVHVEYVWFLDETAKNLEYENRIFNWTIEILYCQFHVLEG